MADRRRVRPGVTVSYVTIDDSALKLKEFNKGVEATRREHSKATNRGGLPKPGGRQR